MLKKTEHRQTIFFIYLCIEFVTFQVFHLEERHRKSICEFITRRSHIFSIELNSTIYDKRKENTPKRRVFRVSY